MADQARAKGAGLAARRAAETVSRLGSELPPAQVQKIYDEVVLSLVASTRLASKLRTARPPSGGPAKE